MAEKNTLKSNEIVPVEEKQTKAVEALKQASPTVVETEVKPPVQRPWEHNCDENSW